MMSKNFREIKSVIGEEENTIDPIYDFLYILVKNDYGVPEDMNAMHFVHTLMHSFEDLSQRINERSYET